MLGAVYGECDWPPAVRALPVITAFRVDASRLSSCEIDAAVRDEVRDGRPLYTVDREILETVDPDLILTQNLCAVCAVSADSVKSSAPPTPRSWLSMPTPSARSGSESFRSPTALVCQPGAAP